jgi:hypothetical protein
MPQWARFAPSIPYLLALAVSVLDFHSTVVGVILLGTIGLIGLGVVVTLKPIQRHARWGVPFLVVIGGCVVVALALLGNGTRRIGPVVETRVPAPPPVVTPSPEPGFRAYRSEGYFAQFPSQWRVSENDAPHDGNRRTVFNSPSGGLSVTIDWSPGDDTDPEIKARQVEEGQLGGTYRRIHIKPLTLGPHHAAEWVFEVDGTRAVDYFIRVGNNVFAVEGDGSDFHDAVSNARAVARSLALIEPTSGAQPRPHRRR